ncbi:MAG: branched-chain amino acid ABC transporter permease [Thermoflexia bacterium]|nr:MAG: branched-chain amino acid ABC transporter permease [Thermoflexia bacterium]
MALGENEEAAEVLGVNTQGCKLQALAIYAFLVGMAGGVYACMYGFIHPNFFSGSMSTEVAILGIVGGMGFTYGPMMAAVVLVSMREFLRARLRGQLEGLYLVVYSVALITVALFRPQGIAPLVRQAYDRFLAWAAKE